MITPPSTPQNRQPPSRQPPRPNFLIVGAARAGTTSLHAWLSGHPQVFLPTDKEPSYFVHDYGLRLLDDYLSLFAPAGAARAIGEASAAYLAAPESPMWIRDALGPVRIIMVLRDPAKRAASLYAWMAMNGYESLPTFEAALQAEDARAGDPDFAAAAPQYVWDYYYFRSGLYAQQVRRYLAAFGAENVLPIRFDDLAQQPEAVYERVCTFLGIDAGYVPALEAHNAGRLPRSVPLQCRLRQARDSARLALPGAVEPMRRLMQFNLTLGRRPQVHPDTLAALTQRYCHDITELSQLLKWDLRSWQSSPTSPVACARAA
ncbi:MAG: sulfotransferase [Phycisphaeraceae bacterium]